MIRTSSIDTVQRNKLESLIRSGLSKFTYIHSVKSNPWGGRIIKSDLGDPRLLEGTVKMAKDVSWTYGHVDIHYLYHERVGFFDFKYIDNK